MNILLSETNDEWADKIKNFIGSEGHSLDVAISGRDAQSRIYKRNYDIVILDFSTTNHSALEVLRYIRMHNPHLKVILTFSSKQFFDELDFDETELVKMGASDILIKPFEMRQLKRCLLGDIQFDRWKKATETRARTPEAHEMYASDNEFTRIKADGALVINHAIFDIYVRVGKDRYIKILYEGDTLAQNRLQEYQAKKVEFFYFKTRDRGAYINFINVLLSKVMSKINIAPSTKVELTKNMVDKFVEEIYTNGIKQPLIDEGKMLSQNIYQFIQSDRDLDYLLKQHVEQDANFKYLHMFLVSFFATIICKSTEWARTRTIESVVMGALLHDIGKIKLPQELRLMDSTLMTTEQLDLYKQHPHLGCILLQPISLIPEPVLQIVGQHHEVCDGSGFPAQLTSTKIYPLAKIVGLADHFTNLMLREKLSPQESLRFFLNDRKNIHRFEADLVLKLAHGFLGHDKFVQQKI